ncbi:MAG: type II secretion system F family protein [Pirellulales bacterium]
MAIYLDEFLERIGFSTLRLRRGPTWKLTPLWYGSRLNHRQFTLQQAIAASIEHRLEPAPLIRNLASEHRGYYRRTLRRLARRIESGTPLTVALEQTPGVLSNDAVLALQYGSQLGTLRENLLMTLESEPKDAEVYQPMRRLLSYQTICVSLTILVAAFIAVTIIPVSRHLAREFGAMDYFGGLRPVVEVVSDLANFAPILAFVVVPFLLLFGAPVARRWLIRSFPQLFAGPRRVLRKARLLELLSTSLEQGRPLPSALSTLARYHFDRSLRLKLLETRNNVEQGADAWQCLSEAGIVNRHEAAVMQSARSGAVGAWALRAFARRRRAEFAAWIAGGTSILFPCVVLGFGAIVLSVWWIVFGFVVQLTQSLS